MIDIAEPVKNRFSPEEFKERLETFKSEISLPKFESPKNINDVMARVSDYAYLREVLSSEIAEWGVVLSAYAIFLTTQENRLQAYIDWCESNIQYIVGENLDKVADKYFAEKDLYIRSHESNARELDKLKLEASVKLHNIKNVAKKLELLVNTLRNLYFERKGPR